MLHVGLKVSAEFIYPLLHCYSVLSDVSLFDKYRKSADES